jgi:hypothetical protein
MSKARNDRLKTEFGIALRDLFEARRMPTSYSAIARALTAHGYEVSNETVARWSTGAVDVPREVLPVLRDMLELSQKEQDELGQAFAWGQTFSTFLNAA